MTPHQAAVLKARSRRSTSSARATRLPSGGLEGQQLVDQIVSRWASGEAPDALAALEEHPEVAANRQFALDLVYEEYCLRRERDETIDVDGFCGRFSGLEHSVWRQLNVHQALDDDLEAVRAAVESAWPQPGDERFGCTIEDELGRGAFARVYLARDPHAGNRPLVLKAAYGAESEAHVHGPLTHPHIVRLFSVTEPDDAGLTAIKMPFCGRSTLVDLLDVAFADERSPTGAADVLEAAARWARPDDDFDTSVPAAPFAPDDTYVDAVLALGARLAGALDHAHQNGVLHGDLKPSNVLLTPGGAPMLLDFNLADGPAAVSERVGGTLPYMAPEKLRVAILHEPSPVDARADLYSLVVMLSELLTGKPPFGRLDPEASDLENARELLSRQQAGPLLANPDGLDPAIARRLTEWLAVDPEERPATGADLARDLDALRAARSQTRRIPARRLLVAGLILAVAGLLTIAAWRPNAADASFQRGLVALQRQEFPAAYDAFDQSVRLDESARNVEAQAWAALESDEYHIAFKLYRLAIDLGRDTASTRNNLGYCKLKRGDVAGAEEEFDHSIEIDGSHYQPYLNLARIDLDRSYADKTRTYLPERGARYIAKAIPRQHRSHGIKSGDLCYLAASIHALIAAQRPEEADTALRFLAEAHVRGSLRSSAELDNGRTFAPLRDLEGFEALREPPRQPLPSAQIRRTIPPPEILAELG